jgi:mannose-6-phosphate isomerase-like protein (cupin superfamily)
LNTLAVTTAIYFRAEFGASYAIKVPSLARVARFHVLLRGECWVHVGDDGSIHLRAGDFVLAPYGAAHVLNCGNRSSEVLLEDAFIEAG